MFAEERRQLYANIFKKSFFLLTGKPGAGKTFETSKVIEHLNGLHEEVGLFTSITWNVLASWVIATITQVI
jgi:Cdc6-like AAA superfamily ATPase